MSIVVQTDGGSRGNPGPAAIGVVISNDGVTTVIAKIIGRQTNNVAEYSAVVEALTHLKKMQVVGEPIQFYLDSLLVVEQLNGRYKINDPILRQLFLQVNILCQELGSQVSFAYVPREKNREADALVNKALDEASAVRK